MNNQPLKKLEVAGVERDIVALAKIAFSLK